MCCSSARVASSSAPAFRCNSVTGLRRSRTNCASHSGSPNDDTLVKITIGALHIVGASTSARSAATSVSVAHACAPIQPASVTVSAHPLPRYS